MRPYSQVGADALLQDKCLNTTLPSSWEPVHTVAATTYLDHFGIEMGRHASRRGVHSKRLCLPPDSPGAGNAMRCDALARSREYSASVYLSSRGGASRECLDAHKALLRTSTVRECVRHP